MLKKFRSLIAYILAVFSLIVITYLFVNLGSISTIISELPFMKINPIYSGGEICNEVIKEDYKIYIHKPVFPSLLGDAEFGFIQLDYKYDKNMVFNDSIDYNLDNQVDFYISSSTNPDSVHLISYNEEVQNINRNIALNDGRLIRISLKRKNED